MSANASRLITRIDSQDDYPATIDERAGGNLPSVNHFEKSGRMGTNAWNVRAAGTFTAPTLVYEQNSSTAWSEVGKFIHNNTTHGGTAGTITTTTDDLLTAMGRTGDAARYGIEFFIAASTMGSGTTGLYSGKYQLLRNGGTPITGISNYVTFSFWMRAFSGTSIIVRKNDSSYGDVEVYKDEVLESADATITVADGWTHITFIQQISIGYLNGCPAVYTDDGTVMHTALWCHFPGRVVLPKHTAPVPNITD